MFAVRNIFSRPGLLQQTIADLAAKGELPAALAAEKTRSASSSTRRRAKA
jgi:hypothetical protein